VFPKPLRVINCRIEGSVDLSGTSLSKIDFTGTSVNSMTFDGAEITGDVVLADGFTTAGTVEGSSANIGRNLVLKGAVLLNRGGTALALDGAEVGASVVADDLKAVGAIHAVGLRVGGQITSSWRLLFRASVAGGFLGELQASVGATFVRTRRSPLSQAGQPGFGRTVRDCFSDVIFRLAVDPWVSRLTDGRGFGAVVNAPRSPVNSRQLEHAPNAPSCLRLAQLDERPIHSKCDGIIDVWQLTLQ